MGITKREFIIKDLMVQDFIVQEGREVHLAETDAPLFLSGREGKVPVQESGSFDFRKTAGKSVETAPDRDERQCRPGKMGGDKGKIPGQLSCGSGNRRYAGTGYIGGCDVYDL